MCVVYLPFIRYYMYVPMFAYVESTTYEIEKSFKIFGQESIFFKTLLHFNVKLSHKLFNLYIFGQFQF